jgi:hypothetical protein
VAALVLEHRCEVSLLHMDMALIDCFCADRRETSNAVLLINQAG